MFYKLIIALVVVCWGSMARAAVIDHATVKDHEFRGYARNNTEIYDANGTLNAKYGPFYMDMPFDHFNNDSTARSFKNRYWVNTNFYKTNGPIILVNAGESAVTDDAGGFLFNTIMAQLAYKLNGIVVLIEHRFYGSSGPNVGNFFENTKEDVATFNSQQALADMAYLIKNIKFHNATTVPPVPQTKVIVYGCSYSGALAAWAKETYPELFFAAVASSAPVQAQMDFYQYYEPIIQYSPKPCINSLQNVISYIDKILFGNSTKEVKALKRLFAAENLHDNSFASLLCTDIGNDWQNGVNATSNQFKNEVCSLFPDSRDTAVEETPETIYKNVLAYSIYVKNFAKATYCSSNSESVSSCLTENRVSGTATLSDDMAAWTWQTCNEFGYFQAAPPANQPTIISRKLDLNYTINSCQVIFKKYGVPSLPPVNNINNQRHGWNIQLDQTIWIDGEWDSWRELSVDSPSAPKKSDSNNSSINIIIPKSTHCANFRVVDNDSPSYLIDAYEQQLTILKTWLAAESH